MNILQVVPYFPPAYAFGGPVKVAYSISKELVKRGHNVTVYTTDAKNPSERLKVPPVMDVDGIEVHYMRNLSLSFIRVSNLFIPPEVAFVSKSELKKFDVIHLHEFTTFQNVAIAHQAKKAGVPYVLQTHGSIHISGRRRRKLLFNTLFGNKILRNASKVIAVSNVEQLYFKHAGLPDHKISVIPNGLDLSDYLCLPPKGSFKKKFGLDANEKIVLYLGRLHKIKGIDILVRAFAEAVVTLDNIKLVIIGPDEGYLAETKALITALKIEDKVLIPGPLYGKDKIEAYVDATVYVLPSRREGFPMSVLEAVACCTPVVVTENCGIAEYFGDKVGLVVKPDPNCLSAALLDILSDECKLNLFTSNCREIIEDFKISKTTSKLEEVYESICDNRNITLIDR